MKYLSAFIHAVDVRTAMSSRYAEMALKSCFVAADKKGFTDVRSRDIEFASMSQFLQSDSVAKTFEFLKKENKIIVIIFDQFEELFSKRELYGLFDNIRTLCNLIDSQKQNIVIGFAWKTDLSIPADHPAYYLWSNLADRRREFEVTQFKTSEIKSALRIFGNQLGEKINPVLASYLTKQCQGYPWLLKKLCIHVYRLIIEGTTQDAVIGKKLNIVDLFERDLSELTPDEHACIKEIAKDTPADFFKIVDLFGNDVIQMLVNKRIVIRRASRLTLYWDIFRDYVIDKAIPNIVLDYIPQQQFVSIAKMLTALIDNKSLSTDDLGKKIGVSSSTIDNNMIDCVMFGVAKRENDIITVATYNEGELVEILQSFFKSHILYIQLNNKFKGEFEYSDFQDLFYSIYIENDISMKTKRTYSAKMYNWFMHLGLIFEKERKTYIRTSKPSECTLRFEFSENTRSRLNTRQLGNELFWGQTSPDKFITAYNLISSGTVDVTELMNMGYKNAIEALISTKGLYSKNGTLFLNKSMDEIMSFIQNSPTIILAKEVMGANPGMKGLDIGERLNETFARDWTLSSKRRYGNAILLWTRFLLTRS
jgi:hypothetical protein